MLQQAHPVAAQLCEFGFCLLDFCTQFFSFFGAAAAQKSVALDRQEAKLFIRFVETFLCLGSGGFCLSALPNQFVCPTLYSRALRLCRRQSVRACRESSRRGLRTFLAVKFEQAVVNLGHYLAGKFCVQKTDFARFTNVATKCNPQAAGVGFAGFGARFFGFLSHRA